MITLRKATSADIELIHTLGVEIFTHTYQGILSPEQISYMLDTMYSHASLKQQIEVDEHRYFIAYDEAGKACGYLSLQRESPKVMELQKIYILPSYHGKGIGKQLIDYAISYTQQEGASCIELHVNRGNKALNFYQHLGFEIARTADFDIGNGYFMNDHIMSLKV